MKKGIFWFFKAAAAGLIAWVLVSFFCFFYYNLPIHYSNENRATDYCWDKNHLSMRGTEGFAFTKTDENGFINTFPDKKEEIDVLVMGSSHVEAFNVDADENLTYVLNEKLKDNGHDKYAYSIGTSGHDFLRCLRNLDAALETYTPNDYVVIETAQIEWQAQDVAQLNDGTYPVLSSFNSGLSYHLQKSDFFRLVYAQLHNFLKNNEKEAAPQQPLATDEEASAEYEQLIDTAVQRAADTVKKHGCKVLFVYCPPLQIDYNGAVVPQEYSPKQACFKNACEKYDVEYIDMFAAFATMYDTTKHLPHGFSNTGVGVGHTNKYGHRCIAEEIYNYIV